MTNHWTSSYDPPILGKQYGELTVIEDFTIEKKKTRDYLKTQCSCGKIKYILIDHLIRGRSTSCGHWSKSDRNKLRNKMINRPSKFEELIHVKNGLVNNYTLIEFESVGRSKSDRRTMTYSIQCDCGYIQRQTNTESSPLWYAKHKKCPCRYKNILQDYRIKNSYTIDDIAFRFNVTPQHVRIWENPAYDISKEHLNGLFDLYLIPPTLRKLFIQYKKHINAEILE